MRAHRCKVPEWLQALKRPAAQSGMVHTDEQQGSTGEGVGDAHRISKRSQVLVPSPQGDLRVVMCSTLVGMRTGPFTFRCFSLAPRIRSAHTAKRK